jgi:hypothetical protein
MVPFFHYLRQEETVLLKEPAAFVGREGRD